jgi:hypothetical protein
MLISRCKLLVLVLILLTTLIPSLVYAKWAVVPRVNVEEQYDDNIFLTEKNEQDDLIITISPGILLNYLGPTGEIKVDYEFGRSFYSDFSDLDYTEHRARADARADITPSFRVAVSETFLRSEDPIELTGTEEFERPSIRTGRRNRYTRNILEPETTFVFAENNSIRLGYRNDLLRNDRDDIADQDEHAVNGLLIARFNINNGIELFYEHIDQDYDTTIPPEPPKDFKADNVIGKYIYYFNPGFSAFVSYEYYDQNFERETPEFLDYTIHDPRLGITWDITANVSLLANAGYAFRDTDGGSDEETFTGRGDLTGRYQRLTLTLFGETGFGGDYKSAEAFGADEFWRAGFTLTYNLLERLWFNGYFYIEESDFVDVDRRDTLYSARATLSYQALKWLFLSLEYERNERDSDVPFDSYESNRYFGRLRVEYDIAEFL